MSFSLLLRAAAYYASMICFGVVAGALNLLSAACGWVPAGDAAERFFQRLIHRNVKFYFRWLEFFRVVHVEYRNWNYARCEQAVVVANHPGMLDAFYLLARVPRGICIFKNAIRRNPILGAVAKRAGYLSNDRAIELVRGATEKIARGATLIVFPEGTRTAADGIVGTLRPGFALIARRAGVPVQLVRIWSDGALLSKQRAWWKLPQLPVQVVVQAGPCLDPRTFSSTAALVAEVETWFHGAREPRGQLTPLLTASLIVP